MNKKGRILLLLLFSVILVVSLIQVILILSDRQSGTELYRKATAEFLIIQPAVLSEPQEQTELQVQTEESPPPPPEPEEEPEQASNTPRGTVTTVQSVAEVTVDFAALTAVNSDAIGWLIIEQTVINYPLLQGQDNETYLTTAYNGTKNSQGSIFMDCDNDPNFSNRHTMIYGHYMRNGTMFGGLNQYAQQSYFEGHRYFYIFTESGLLSYEIFSAYTADVDSQTYQRTFPEEGDYEAFLQDIMSQSQITSGVEPDSTDRIVTLSTCTPSSSKQQRFVVHGRLVSYESHSTAS